VSLKTRKAGAGLGWDDDHLSGSFRLPRQVTGASRIPAAFVCTPQHTPHDSARNCKAPYVPAAPPLPAAARRVRAQTRRASWRPCPESGPQTNCLPRSTGPTVRLRRAASCHHTSSIKVQWRSCEWQQPSDGTRDMSDAELSAATAAAAPPMRQHPRPQHCAMRVAPVLTGGLIAPMATAQGHARASWLNRPIRSQSHTPPRNSWTSKSFLADPARCPSVTMAWSLATYRGVW